MRWIRTTVDGGSMAPKTDSQTAGEAFAANLKLLRGRLALSQQQLADQLAEIAFPLDRSAISKIESGQRNVSIDEALAIAVALGVEPAALLFPRTTADVRIAPKMVVSNTRAAMWFRGMHPLSDRPDMQRRFYEERDDGWALMQVLIPGAAGLLRHAALMMSSWGASPAMLRDLLMHMDSDLRDAHRRVAEWEAWTSTEMGNDDGTR